MKKVVGKVTDEEKSAIMRLHNHSCSLEELLMILPENEELYKIALNDLNETKKSIRNGGTQITASTSGKKVILIGL